MNGKKVFYSELAYVFGMVILALGTAMMERADFGMSMVVAPAYLVHLQISKAVPAFTFGMAEYCLQAVLLIGIAMIARGRKIKYVLSLGTAVSYGFTLDLAIRIIGMIPSGAFVGRIVLYVFGMGFCAVGVSLFFHTYLPPEAYELFVKEVSVKYATDIHKTKTVYDCCSCFLAVLLSFFFFGFGHFEGVKFGTVICAALNGSWIGMCSKMMESKFCFKDALELRDFFA